MTKSDFSNLRFEQPRRTIPRRLLFLGATLALFNLLWFRVPRNTQYWILMPCLILLVWLASYGWRLALFAFHDLIHKLEQL